MGLVCNTSTGALTASGSIKTYGGTYYNNNCQVAMVFEPVNGRAYHSALYTHSNGTMYGICAILTYDSGNGQYTIENAFSIWSSSNIRGQLVMSHFANTRRNLQIASTRDWVSSGKSIGIYRVRTVQETTNITLNNFLGFAPLAINDTATGTINLPGNTVDNQSGLSAGTRYFINDDGTYTTNGSVSVVNSHGGLVAVSATKGVIVGQGGFT